VLTAFAAADDMADQIRELEDALVKKEAEIAQIQVGQRADGTPTDGAPHDWLAERGRQGKTATGRCIGGCEAAGDVDLLLRKILYASNSKLLPERRRQKEGSHDQGAASHGG
jgi:hypothetical protein